MRSRRLHYIQTYPEQKSKNDYANYCRTIIDQYPLLKNQKVGTGKAEY
ncbi:unnamed protein product, partial [Didymodactylos carnosus]